MYSISLKITDVTAYQTYFQYYIDISESWACVFRNQEEPDTAAHVESMHRVLKHEYLGGKRIRKVLALLQALLNYEADSFLRYLRLD